MAATMVVAGLGLEPAPGASCASDDDEEPERPRVDELDPLPPPSTHVMGKMVLLPPRSTP